MPEATGELREQLLAFAHHVRDPGTNPPPPGVEDRRLRVYRELFLGSIEGLLAGSFPVIRRILPGERWQALVRDFYTGHCCTTPLFTEVAREFVDWLAGRDCEAWGDPPWLPELAHYEWIEVDLQLRHAHPCRSGHLALSPLARPLAYAWPVHRIGPAWQPSEAPAVPTLLLARRDADGEVQFSELSPLVFRLLQLLDAGDPSRDPQDILDTLATEAGKTDDPGFRVQGTAMLQRLLDEGTLVRGS